MSCLESTNVICKHVGATKAYYVDLSFMPAGVTALEADAEAEDATMDIASPEILDSNVTLEDGSDCGPLTLLAGRAIVIVISGGTPDDDNETRVSVRWTQSNGDADGRYLRLIVR
jgi:hypothetical protein